MSAARNPDAALIALCERHILNHAVYNASAAITLLDSAVDPLWPPYLETYEAIERAQATALDGIVAMARAALVEAEEGLEYGGCGARWAEHVIRDLLLLQGRAGA